MKLFLSRVSISILCLIQLLWSSTLIAGVTIRYQHTNILGSVVLETGVNGEQLTKSDYKPYGERVGGQKAGLGFTGHLEDPELGLTYMQQRYYDPVIGRFYSNDPVDILGHMRRSNQTMGFNRYAYANNNPYKYVDPTGKAPIEHMQAAILDSELVAADGDYQAASSATNAKMDNMGDQFLNAVSAVDTASDIIVPVKGALKAGAKNLVEKGTKQLAKRTCCFVAGTEVLTESGYKNIEDVKLGEKLWAKNTKTGEKGWKPVTKVFIEPEREIFEISLVADDGFIQKIEATDDHPFFVVGKGWKQTVELEKGELIETDGFGPLKVINVIDEKRLALTYNFTISEFHTYHVTKKNVLVHNCNVRNLNKLNEKDGNAFAKKAGYKDAHEAKKGYGDSKVNLYKDKESGDIYIWDGKKESEPQKL